jgi:hypothetical protein
MSLEAVRKQVGKPSGLLVVAKRSSTETAEILVASFPTFQKPSIPVRTSTYIIDALLTPYKRYLFIYYYGSCVIGLQLRNFFAYHLLLLRLWPLNGSPFFYCLFLNVLNAWDRRGSCLKGDQAQHVLHHQFQSYFIVCNARVLAVLTSGPPSLPNI